MTLYSAWLVRHCRDKGLNRQDAEDVAWSAIAKAWRGIPRFRRRRQGSLRRWLLTIAERARIDHLRREAAQPPIENINSPYDLSQLPASNGGDADVANQHTAQRLDRAMETVRQQVEPHTWAAFIKAYVYKEDIRDVAAELGISRHSVWKAGQRVLRRLRNLMEKEEEQQP